jgi:hypothetical protein
MRGGTDEVGLPVGVDDPALVGVGGSDVGGAGDDGGCLASGFVRYVVDGDWAYTVSKK